MWETSAGSEPQLRLRPCSRHAVAYRSLAWVMTQQAGTGRVWGSEALYFLLLPPTSGSSHPMLQSHTAGILERPWLSRQRAAPSLQHWVRRPRAQWSAPSHSFAPLRPALIWAVWAPSVRLYSWSFSHPSRLLTILPGESVKVFQFG